MLDISRIAGYITTPNFALYNILRWQDVDSLYGLWHTTNLSARETTNSC